MLIGFERIDLPRYEKMKIETYTPSAGLKQFVKTFLIIESENGMESRVLPDTSLMMAFRIKGEVAQKSEKGIEKLPSAIISGLRNSPRVFDYAKQTSTLLVAFKEGGAGVFFCEPLHRLFGTSLPLDDFWRRGAIAEIEEKLAESRTNRERIAAVETFLISQIEENQTDLLVLEAVRKIKAAGGDVKIHELVKLFHTSRDPFEKRFRRVTGTSPKQFAQIVRLRNLINHYAPENNFADLAARFGYFDQAHFIKNFKSFTGQTPQIFFKSSNYW